MPIPSDRSLRSTPSTGFTVLDLLIAVAVVGVTLTVAVPTLRSLYHSNLMTSQVNRLVGHLNLARSTAISRGQRALLCPSENGNECLRTPDWHRGWVVFIDGDGNRELDSTEEVLQRVSSTEVDTTVTSSLYRQRIVYQPSGLPSGSNATFTFCNTTGLADSRAVILSNTGRPRVAHTQANGRPWEC